MSALRKFKSFKTAIRSGVYSVVSVVEVVVGKKKRFRVRLKRAFHAWAYEPELEFEMTENAYNKVMEGLEY